MKAQPLIVNPHGTGYAPCEPTEATHVRLHLPGPFPNRILPVMIKGARQGTPNWTWNGSVTAPTLRPSVLTRGGDIDNEVVCHVWISDGQVQFLGDSTHELAGQTLPLLDIEQ